MTLIDVPGAGIVNFVRTGPRGATPLVFLHPVGLDLTWWGDQFAEFGAVRDVIAIDMPGHGRSDRLERKPSFDLLADVIEHIRDTSGVEKLDLVGLSVGGIRSGCTACASSPRCASSTTLRRLRCSNAPASREPTE